MYSKFYHLTRFSALAAIYSLVEPVVSMPSGNITLGTKSKIGAGSVVLKSIPEGATAIGCPGVCPTSSYTPVFLLAIRIV